jgi:hypothetical protein
MMPNLIPPKWRCWIVDLFVNTISLSEMDYETIVEYMSQIARTCREYFYHENLAHFHFSYRNYPCRFFPIPEVFDEVMTSASRWPFFSFNSEEHHYLEALYKRRSGDPSAEASH